jgi:serralysin
MTFELPTALSGDALAEIAYLNGLDANGGPAPINYWSDTGWYPHKWQNTDGGVTATAGAGGGVVTYSFDTNAIGAAPWSDEAKASFVASLTLWSDIANISFQEAAPGTTSDVTFFNDKGDYETDAAYVTGAPLLKVAPGTAEVHVYTDPSHFNLFGDITSFSTYGGYGVGALMHELGHLLGLGHGGPYNEKIIDMQA